MVMRRPERGKNVYRGWSGYLRRRYGNISQIKASFVIIKVSPWRLFSCISYSKRVFRKTHKNSFFFSFFLWYKKSYSKICQSSNLKTTAGNNLFRLTPTVFTLPIHKNPTFYFYSFNIRIFAHLNRISEVMEFF